MKRQPRFRLALLIGAVVVVVAVVVLLVSSGGSDAPAKAPPAEAAKLVPGNALVYVDLSTDGTRAQTKRAAAIAAAFPSFPGLRDSVVRRLTDSGSPQQGDVRRWAGKEAALALLAGTGGTAQSLVLIQVRDRAQAMRYVSQGRSAVGVSRYRQVPMYASGSVVSALVGGFVAIGQQIPVQEAIDLQHGDGTSLAKNASYAKAVAPLPPARVVTGWVTEEGVRRILAPQSGVLGAAGTLLSRPGLLGAGLALAPRTGGAQLTVHSLLDPKQAGTLSSFTPTLPTRVPKNAILALDVQGLNTALGRLLGIGAGTQGLGDLLARAGQALSAKSGGALRAGLLNLLGQEAMVVVTPSLPAPTLTVMTKVASQAGATKAMAALRPTIAQVLAQPASTGKRVAARWAPKPLGGGATAWSLPFAKGAELDYAVFDGLLVVSTRLAGLRAVQHPDGNVTQTAAWQSVLGNHPNPIGSLLFLDFNQLLRLGEQTGLNDSAAYQRVRDDLQRITAVGLVSTPGQDESTAEINLSIP